MDDILYKNFNEMGIEELTVVLNQVGRRLLVIQASEPNVIFWFGIICRLSKWLNNKPYINDIEKKLIVGPNPPEVNGRIRAIKHLRERSGMPLRQAATIIDEWAIAYFKTNSSTGKSNEDNREDVC